MALSTQLGREKSVTTCQPTMTKHRVMEGTRDFEEGCLGIVCSQEQGGERQTQKIEFFTICHGFILDAIGSGE